MDGRQVVYLVFGCSAIAFLLLNLWAIKRREFKWYREGLISLAILAVLGALLFPVLVQTHELRGVGRALLP
jgi:branched-subunit amino acid transport protein